MKTLFLSLCLLLPQTTPTPTQPPITTYTICDTFQRQIFATEQYWHDLQCELYAINWHAQQRPLTLAEQKRRAELPALITRAYSLWQYTIALAQAYGC